MTVVPYGVGLMISIAKQNEDSPVATGERIDPLIVANRLTHTS